VLRAQEVARKFGTTMVIPLCKMNEPEQKKARTLFSFTQPWRTANIFNKSLLGRSNRAGKIRTNCWRRYGNFSAREMNLVRYLANNQPKVANRENSSKPSSRYHFSC
jgi:hypothetical protein